MDKPRRISDAIAREGFARIDAEAMTALLGEDSVQDWGGFAQSWNDLAIDQFMADQGRYRRRRFAAFALSADGAVRKAHQAHYQSLDYNPLNGGIQRWFEPVTDLIAAHPTLHALLGFCHALFTPLTPPALRPAAWHTEVHQFRIEAQAGQQSSPTPEGMHRDGVDWVLVMLVRRENVSSGVTLIRNTVTGEESSFTLASPLDATVMDDRRIAHAVTPISPLAADSPAYRDVLVITLRAPSENEL